MVKILALAVAVVAVALLIPFGPAEEARPEKSPHAAALELVFRKAAERIRAVDRENWWHDVEERAWLVRRPFHPGVIDSTHLFVVTYQVAGKKAAAWNVDTRAGKVEEQPNK